jgi:hypothetical protein
LSAQGLYLFSNQPKTFDPSLKLKNRKKGPFLSWRLVTELARGEFQDAMKAWFRMSQSPGMMAHVKTEKRMTLPTTSPTFS